jgi:hypothetical protein
VIYADPSFLFSFYCKDANSPIAVTTYRADQRRPLLLTAWQSFEFKNAVRLATHKLKRAGIQVPFQIGNVFKDFQEGLQSGRLQYAEVDWLENFQLANELSGRHTASAGTGAVDVWHVAAAILLKADTFWTFDVDQHKLATDTKFFKKVPELPGI